jgi:hypothetical protein
MPKRTDPTILIIGAAIVIGQACEFIRAFRRAVRSG